MIRLLICYDITTGGEGGKRRLRRIAQCCEDYGSRVQYSLFECLLSPANWIRLKSRLLNEINCNEDSLRIYYLCDKDWHKFEQYGIDKKQDFTKPLIF